MKSIVLIIVVVLASAFLSAQPSYQALIDSSVACNPSYGHFFIVEEMPSPIQTLDEIENLLKRKIQFSEQEMDADGQIYVQCLVNCKGDPGDYQLTQCPDALLSVGNQIIEVFRNESFKWKPGKQRGETVDVFLIFQIEVLKGKFEIIVLHLDLN